MDTQSPAEKRRIKVNLLVESEGFADPSVGADAADKIIRFLQEAHSNGWNSVSFDDYVDGDITLAAMISGEPAASSTVYGGSSSNNSPKSRASPRST
jgi:hypothetical protein